MQKVEVRFQFPDSEDRYLIRKVVNLDHLKKLMFNLRNSQKYEDLSLRYSIRDWSDGKGSVTFYKLSVYFTCCIDRHRNPKIIYLSRDKQNFQLEQGSTYIHRHQIKKKKAKNSLQFQIQNIHLNSCHQIRKNNQNKNSQRQNINQLNLLNQEQNNPTQGKNNFSNSILHKIVQKQVQNQKESLIFQHRFEQQKHQKQKQKIFDFPSVIQLSRIQRIASRGSVLGSMSNFVKLIKFKNLQIQFQSLIHQQNTKQGLTVFHLFIGFRCCTGIDNNFPYLHYIKKFTSNFHLVDYNLTHDHLNGISKKIWRRNQKQIKKSFSQIMSKRQNSLRQDRFSQFPSLNEKKILQRQEVHKGIIVNQKSQKYHEKDETNQLTIIKEIQNKIRYSNSQQKEQQYQQKAINSQQFLNKSSFNEIYKTSQFQTMEIQELQKKQLIFYQLQNLSEKVTNFIVQKQWKSQSVKKPYQEMQDQSQGTNNQLIVTYRTEDHKIWTSTILEILNFNEIEIINIEKQKARNGDEEKLFQFQNVLFVSKAWKNNFILNKQTKNNNQTIQIYLSLYPIKIAKRQHQMKILVAYTLSHQNNPNLLWFYATVKNLQLLNLAKILDKNNDTQSYFKVLTESIKYFDLKNVNFIYTSLDRKLLDSLDKICRTKQVVDSEHKFRSFMHFQGLKSILNDQKFPQDYLLQDYIQTKIQNFSNQENILESYKFLKNIFYKEEIEGDNFMQNAKNPRIIFQKYLTFTQPFSNTQTDKELSKLRYSLIFGDLYKMTVLKEAQNIFSQLEQIFNHFDQFNNFAQTFIFILRTFDSTIRQVPSNTTKKRIIPFKINKLQTQASNYKILSTYRQKLHDQIKNVFSQSVFQLKSIANKFPEFISLTIYHLILEADKLLKQNLRSIISHKQSASKFFVDLQQGQLQKTFKVSFIDGPQHKKFQQDSSNFYSLQKNKKWSCTCNFYKQTGIPCEHEILAAIQNKNSLLNQIHFSWQKND